MAISPTDIEIHKRKAEAAMVQSVVKAMEKYCDAMLVMGWRDILLDKAIDNKLSMNYRKILKESQRVQDEFRKLYRMAGWKIDYRCDFKYVNFKEA